MKIYEIKNLSFSYSENKIFENINLDIEDGEFVGIVGDNGSGKSTLIKLLIGELKGKGTIKVFSENIEKFNQWYRFGYTAQSFQDINFPISCEEMILLDLFKKISFKYKKENTKKIDEVLEIVEMKQFKYKNFMELSGGQKQRILLAKALVRDPDVIILDEPTKGLDSKAKASFLGKIRDLNKDYGKTIILITHEINDTLDYFSNIYKVGDGDLKCLNINS